MKYLILSCPSGSLNTEEQYLWCDKYGKECQNVRDCAFRSKLHCALCCLDKKSAGIIKDELGVHIVGG